MLVFMLAHECRHVYSTDVWHRSSSLLCSLSVIAIMTLIKLQLCFNVCIYVIEWHIFLSFHPQIIFLTSAHASLFGMAAWLSLPPAVTVFFSVCLGRLSKQETAKFTKRYLRNACKESRRVKCSYALLLIYSSLLASLITPVPTVTKYKRHFIEVHVSIVQ